MVFGLFPAKPAFDLGDLHTFARTMARTYKSGWQTGSNGS